MKSTNYTVRMIGNTRRTVSGYIYSTGALRVGISNRDQREVDIKRAMLKASDRVYLLADSSKFDSRMMVKVSQ